MIVLFVKKCPTMYCSGLTNARGNTLLGEIKSSINDAMYLSTTESQFVIDNIEGGADYWGTKKVRKPK